MEQESTIISGNSGGFDNDRTQTLTPAMDRTQMGASVECPVCRSRNLSVDEYCVECGFLLSSQPAGEVEAPPEAPAKLIDTRSSQSFPLWEGENSVGRENSDVLLSDPSVSRSHAVIIVSGSSVTVKDLGSTNGSYVAGVRMDSGASAVANPADEVRFGSSVLRLEIAEPSEVVEAPEDTIEESAEGLFDTPSEEPETAEPVEVSPELSGPRLIQKDTGEVYPISTDGAAIGRRDGNDIVIPNPYISSRHAAVSLGGDKCILTDIGSTNGTTINGQKLEANVPYTLNEGDEIGFGPITLVYTAGEGE